MRVRIAAAGLLAALIGTLLGCSSGTAASANWRQSAQQARQAAGQAYWRMVRSALTIIQRHPGQVHSQGLSDGTGKFSECTPHGQVTGASYEITTQLIDREPSEPSAAFTSKLRRLLQSEGWKNFGNSQGTLTASAGTLSISATLVGGIKSPDEVTKIDTPCFSASENNVEKLVERLYDSFPLAQASAGPIPTSLP